MKQGARCTGRPTRERPRHMALTENPTFLAVETHEGRANLAGKRRLVDDFDEAVEVADEIDGLVFALEPVEAAPFAPVAAVRHVRLSGEPYDSPLDAA